MDSKALSPSNLKFVLAYDGLGFYGWQKTDVGPSVEGTFQSILEQIFQQEIALQAASRTDAGVHAEGQVVNCLVREKPVCLEKLQLSLNRLLPDTIAVLEVDEMPLTFHPTADAVSKEYHYCVSYDRFQLPHDRHRFWHCPCRELDFEAMNRATQLLVGERDFSSFTWTKKKEDYQTLIRELTRVEIVPLANKRLRMELCGSNFLYRMARTLAGTLMGVGCGKLKMEEVLEACDRRFAGMTAPAHGLTLYKVFYK